MKPLCPLAVLTLILALTGPVATAEGGRSVEPNYRGSARALLPSSAESYFDKRLRPRRAQPPAPLRVGFRSGWQAVYQDAMRKILERRGSVAGVSILVYDTRAHARRAFHRLCARKCGRAKIGRGVRASFSPMTTISVFGTKMHSVRLTATSGTLLLRIVDTGRYRRHPLRYNDAFLARVVIRKARAR
jgi:hypothetical protein